MTLGRPRRLLRHTVRGVTFTLLHTYACKQMSVKGCLDPAEHVDVKLMYVSM